MLNNLKNPKIQQYALELLFPVIGYLWFDWTLLIIVVFYLLDHLGSEIAFIFRLKFVQKIFIKHSKSTLVLGVASLFISFSLIVSVIYLIFSLSFYDCQKYFFNIELYEFLKSEMLILMPALFLLHFLKDRMSFYKTDIPFYYPPIQLLKYRLCMNGILLVFVIACFFLIPFYKLNEIGLVFTIALAKLINDTIILKRLRLYLFKKI